MKNCIIGQPMRERIKRAEVKNGHTIWRIPTPTLTHPAMPRLPAQPNMTRVPSGDTAAYSSSPSYPPPGTMQTPNPMVHASGGWLQNPPMPYQVPQGPLGPQYRYVGTMNGRERADASASQPNGLYNGVYPNTLNNHTGPGPALQSNGGES